MIFLEIDQPENDPILEVTTELSEITFTILLRWDDRLEAWYLDLFDADATAIVVGTRLTTNYLLFNDLRDSRLPPGRLALINPNSNDPCGFEDLGPTCFLVYFEPGEFTEPKDVARVEIPFVLTAVPPP